ncbi:MAG: hypothetical protein QNJ31_06170 [Candidatus Caenarcaniphilales bacterium]|nr:hypothetical protein [Candidatus Caenarcaniphilales bacterium]
MPGALPFTSLKEENDELEHCFFTVQNLKNYVTYTLGINITDN